MTHIDRLFEQARRQHLAGRLGEAQRLYQQVLSIEPQHAHSLHLLGVVAHQSGQHKQAIELIGRATRIDSTIAAYHSNLGSALQAEGQLDEAIVSYRRALALEPAIAETYYNLGSALAAQGRHGEALTCHEQALALSPTLVAAHYELGNALRALGRPQQALAAYDRALALDPQHAPAHNNRGYALHLLGRLNEAEASYRRALAIDPDYADAHHNLGFTLYVQDKLEQAVACYRRALALNPDYPEVCNNLGNALKDQGRFDEALALYDRALELRPDFAQAHFNRADVHRFRPGDSQLQALCDLAARGCDIAPDQQPLIHFALAKALEDIGEHARAFEQLLKANALQRRQIDYFPQRVAAQFERVRRSFDAELVRRLQGAGDPSELPIFIVGMPRSGTTLIEQVLASHPQVHAAGELTALDAVVAAAFPATRSADAYPQGITGLDAAAASALGRAYLARLPRPGGDVVRVVDKLPGNFVNVGLIHLILPRARIIHVMRDPVDTCFSAFSKLFRHGQHFSYDLAELGRYYRHYRELMAHWRSVLPAGAMLEVCYEEVVEDLPGQARRVIEYCGLPWDERCLGFHAGSRVVSTASAVQVRQPLYRGSLGRGRRYAAWLAPLLNELHQAD